MTNPSRNIDTDNHASITDDNARLIEQVSALKAQLVQAQKLGSVGVLASSITHEFNNILMTTINYAKMGLRHKDAATREKAFNKILSAGQRASKITTGMLAFSRAKGNRREAMSLTQVLQDVLVLVEKDLQMNRVRLQSNFIDQPYAEVNAGQVQQVLLNLLINARQAMQGGGVLNVTVRSNEADGMGEIAIRDTGCGIPAEKLPTIFEAFVSTKVADENGQGGTGLGLALCKDIVDAHGGRVRVESAMGEGTCFTLRFPLVEKPQLMAAG